VRLARPDAAIVSIRMPPTPTDEGLVAAQASGWSIRVLAVIAYLRAAT
jgi:hypothetical protein